MKHILYGDGIHDDAPAIQEMIDSGVCEVNLPAPAKHYLITKPLELPSDFRLTLPRFAVIRLADDANCVMLRNKVVYDYARRLSPEVYEHPTHAHLWGYVDDYSPNAPCQNIEVCGGIWDCNNMGQIPNQNFSKDFSVREHCGYGMLFYNVRNLKIHDLTVKDPVRYGITMAVITYFTVENLTFDYNKGNPYPVNMDGVHLDGNCHFGVFRNLQGRCYDDLIALNAHEGARGDITDIEIDGIFADECHSAVRLLLVAERIENIHISNVFGTYYQYCVGVSKFYPGENTGRYDGITVDHVYAAKAMPARKGDFQHPKHTEDCFPLIWVQGKTVVGSLAVCDLHRREQTLPRETVFVGKGATVERLTLRDISTQNETGHRMPLLANHGHIRTLTMTNTDSQSDPVLVNYGRIDQMN